MSSNKRAKNELIKYYGAECFIEKLHLRVDTERRKYKSKRQMKKMKELTYHHIKMKKDGGEATRENGALLSNENHVWFHKQSEEDQRYMNKIFQEYKQRTDECRIEFVDEIEPPFKIKIKALTFKVNERGKYNRAEKKRKDRELVNDYYDEL